MKNYKHPFGIRDLLEIVFITALGTGLLGYILNLVGTWMKAFSTTWNRIIPILVIIGAYLILLVFVSAFSQLVLLKRNLILSMILEEFKTPHGLPFFSPFERLITRIIGVLGILYFVLPLWEIENKTTWEIILISLASLLAALFIFAIYQNTSEGYLFRKSKDPFFF